VSLGHESAQFKVAPAFPLSALRSFLANNKRRRVVFLVKDPEGLFDHGSIKHWARLR